MKRLIYFRPITLLMGIAMLFIFILGSKVKGQDSVPEKSDETIRMIVTIDEDGNSYTIDTTFSWTGDYAEAMKQMLEKHKDQMKDLEISWQEFREPDTPRDFYYQFDYPYARVKDDCPKKDPRKSPYHWYGEQDIRVNRVPGYNTESLNDVLGDIPMSSVRSYQIKERKGGKRIIIDVSDDVGLTDRDAHFMYIRSPRPVVYVRPERKSERIVIESD